jgi:hypothetical protein
MSAGFPFADQAGSDLVRCTCLYFPTRLVFLGDRGEGESPLRYCVFVLFAGFLLALLPHTATAASAGDIRRALASPWPVLLVGVPEEFLNTADVTDDGEIETRGDWSYYLNDWAKSASKKIKIIVVPIAVLNQALQSPSLGDSCATLFVKNRTEGLLYSEDCVPQLDVYEEGAGWLLGTARSGGPDKRIMKSTMVTLRSVTK